MGIDRKLRHIDKIFEKILLQRFIVKPRVLRNSVIQDVLDMQTEKFVYPEDKFNNFEDEVINCQNYNPHWIASLLDENERYYLKEIHEYLTT